MPNFAIMFKYMEMVIRIRWLLYKEVQEKANRTKRNKLKQILNVRIQMIRLIHIYGKCFILILKKEICI